MAKHFGILAVLCVVACASDGSGPGSGGSAVVGQACSNDGYEVCSGTKVLQCNTNTGTLAWNVKKDCADTGRTCVTVSDADADCN